MRPVLAALLLIAVFIQLAAPVHRPAPVQVLPQHAGLRASRGAGPGRVIMMTVTFYSNAENHPRSSPEYGITATGVKADDSTAAADWTILKPGTRVFIPGVGLRVITDKGVKGNKLDVWLPTAGECFKKGKREVVVRILN